MKPATRAATAVITMPMRFAFIAISRAFHAVVASLSAPVKEVNAWIAPETICTTFHATKPAAMPVISAMMMSLWSITHWIASLIAGTAVSRNHENAPWIACSIAYISTFSRNPLAASNRRTKPHFTAFSIGSLTAPNFAICSVNSACRRLATAVLPAFSWYVIPASS